MIPKKLRLQKNRVRYLLQKGRKLSNLHLSIKFLGTNKTESHFCVVVSAKIEPLAVKRNKIRRQLYEIIRLHHERLVKRFDMILIVRPSIRNLSYKNLEQIVINIFDTLAHE